MIVLLDLCGGVYVFLDFDSNFGFFVIVFDFVVLIWFYCEYYVGL